MNIKLSHQKFIEHCKTKGIIINKITRDLIHIEKIHISDVLPNIRGELFHQDILWSMGYKRIDGTKSTLKDAIHQNQRIECIKIIRNVTGLGLKDSKDIVCDNWDKWVSICGSEPQAEENRICQMTPSNESCLR